MLVVMRQGQVLLEKRPAAGIWGGLWSLPETDVATRPAEAAARLGLRAVDVAELPALEHAFTHFVLEMRPFRVSVAEDGMAAESPGRVWLPLAEAVGAALPAPVRRLLRGLAAGTVTSLAGTAEEGA